jgi:hypothetical protein
MEAMRQSWTDERLDEFGKRVDERFDRVDERFDDLSTETNRRFDEVDRRVVEVNTRLMRIEDGVYGLQRAMVYGVIAIGGAMLAGFAAMTTLGATQL